ncbi:MAG: selenium cofactor biosynthesis protein YqeC, partial [Pseudomonadota bacterium]
MENAADIFGLDNKHYIFLIGGGGKTSLMFLLARQLAEKGRSVITTTSTKIIYPTEEQSTQVIVSQELTGLLEELHTKISHSSHVTAGKTLLKEQNKLSGFSAEELDVLFEANIADYIIVEADGAAGCSLKAHNEYEPVVSPKADLVIAVIGID